MKQKKLLQLVPFSWAKKISVFLLCASAWSITASAQSYQVGEAYVKDGIPCVIIHVDESGQHGLAMSLPVKSGAVKKAKKEGEDKWFYTSQKLKGEAKKQQKAYLEEYYHRTKCDSVKIQTSGISTATRLSTSLHGKENTKNILDYCNAEGIDMEMYFPEYAWAKSLGEDWFIPGAEEMEMLVKTIGFENFGHKIHTMKTFSVQKNIKEKFQNSIPENYKTSFQEVWEPYYINSALSLFSSTVTYWKGNDINSAILFQATQKLSGQTWYNMAVPNPWVSPIWIGICAVCEF